MIKIDLEKIDIRKIEEKHKEYVFEVSLEKLTSLLKEKGYKKKDKVILVTDKEEELLKLLFGETIEEHKEALLKYCIGRELKEITIEFEKSYSLIFNEVFSVEVNKKKDASQPKAFRKIIEYIFDYSGFNEGTKEWNRHIFLDSLGTKVCPYCNRNYITSFKSDGKRRTTADADHYMHKANCPILRLNIYNLIPSCGVCNSRLKGQNKQEHLNPYFIKGDELRFNTGFTSIDELYNYDEAKVSIDILDNDSELAIGSKEVFKLREVYQVHKGVVFDLKNKIKDYAAFEDENYYKVLTGLDIFDKKGIENDWFDFLGKEHNDEPLSKLKEDIYSQIMNSIK